MYYLQKNKKINYFSEYRICQGRRLKRLQKISFAKRIFMYLKKLYPVRMFFRLSKRKSKLYRMGIRHSVSADYSLKKIGIVVLFTGASLFFVAGMYSMNFRGIFSGIFG